MKKDHVLCEYDAVISAVSKKECSLEVVQRAKYTLYDLLCVQNAENEGCIIPRPIAILGSIVAAIGTVGLAMVVMFMLPWTESMIGSVDAVAPWWLTEIAVFGMLSIQTAIIMAFVTTPAIRFILKRWMRRKIRRLKRAIAKMPKELVRGWSFMEPDRYAR